MFLFHVLDTLIHRLSVSHSSFTYLQLLLHLCLSFMGNWYELKAWKRETYAQDALFLCPFSFWLPSSNSLCFYLYALSVRVCFIPPLTQLRADIVSLERKLPETGGYPRWQKTYQFALKINPSLSLNTYNTNHLIFMRLFLYLF